MKSAASYTVAYTWLLPLLQSLRDKGLTVSPDTHIQLLRLFEACGEKINGDNLLHYIGPVIAKNAAQYKLLKETYAEFLEKTFHAIPPPPPPLSPQPPSRSFKWLYLLIPVAIAALAGIYFLLRAPSLTEVRTSITVTADPRAKTPVSFFSTSSLRQTNPTDTQRLRFIWQFGDGTVDSGSYHVDHLYNKPGLYTVSVHVKALSPHLQVLTPDTSMQLRVCQPSTELIQDPKNDINIGQPVQFTLNYDSAWPPQKIHWFVDDTLVQENGFRFNHTFKVPGPHLVSYNTTVAGDSLCEDRGEISIPVRAPVSTSISLTPQGGLTSAPTPYLRSLWIGLLALLILLPLVAALIVWRWLAAKKKRSRVRAKLILNTFNGRGAPYEIPFKNHDELIADERELLSVAKSYKRRSVDEVLYLDVPQTINATIRSEGMLQTVWATKTKPVEYLILIDKNNAKSQQVCLFEYLLKKFARNDLYLEKFYFQFEPDICNNAAYPNGIHVSRLHDLYPNHVLILFGTGHQLIDKHYPALNTKLLPFFKKWNQWAICTPVSFADWDYKERIIQRAAVLMPADLKGQLLLFRLLESNGMAYEEHLQDMKTYQAGNKNFNDPQDLKAYLKDEFLFQWLCAMAVYPRIEWNVLVAIGDALQKTNYPDGEITYSALLKLVRIQWMHEGSFPDSTRLALLKHLQPRNEAVARETMIAMLEEAALKMDEDSFSFEELRMQLLTNKFLLYASDPAAQKYQPYEEAWKQFKTLWEQRKIHDYPLSAYLAKDDKKESWSTLIGNATQAWHDGAGMPMSTYFKDALPLVQKKVRRVQLLLVALAILFTGLLAVLYYDAGRLAYSNANTLLSLITTDSNKNMPVIFAMAFDSCFNYDKLSNDSTRFTFTLPGGEQRVLNTQDTALQLQLPYQWIQDSLITLAVRSNKTTYNLDTAFNVRNAKLLFGIAGCDTASSSPPIVNDWIPGGLSDPAIGEWFPESISTGAAAYYNGLHIENGSVEGFPIAKVFTSAGNSQLHKVIVQRKGAYQVYYLQFSDQADRIKTATVAKLFTTQAEAEKDSTRPILENSVKISLQNRNLIDKRVLQFFAGAWSSRSNNGDTVSITTDLTTLTTQKMAWGIEMVQRVPSGFSIPVYRVRMIGNNQKKGVYIIPVTTNQILFAAEENEGSQQPFNFPVIGTFNKLTRVQAIPWKPVALPRALHEIWHNSNTNRVLSFLDPNTFFYAQLNDKENTTGKIEQVLVKNNVYRIITSGGRAFKVFAIRNIAAGSFEFSTCQGAYTSISAVQAMADSYCDQFNTMQLYYSTDDRYRILIPADAKTYVASETAKINELLGPMANRKDGDVTVDTIKVYVNTFNEKSDREARFSAIRQNCPLNKLTDVKWVNIPFRGDLTQRDYILTTTKKAPVQQYKND